MATVIETIMNRRSVRAYLDKDIPAAERALIIQAALRAPTAGGQMLYSIIEVDDQELKEKLVQTCDNQPFIAKAPLVLLFLADYQRWFDYYQFSDVNGLCEREGLTPRTPGAGDFMLACCDAVIATQTAVLAAEGLGIGSCYIGDIMENYEIHQAMFDLPDYAFPIAMVCFGYPTEQQKKRDLTPRFDQDLIVYKNKYQQMDDDTCRQMFANMVNNRWDVKHYLKSAVNIGQHNYLRKFSSDFALEMNRSVQVALEKWLKNHSHSR